MSGLPVNNYSHTNAFKYNIQPNLTAQTPVYANTGNIERHNFENSQRYAFPYASKTAVQNNARVVEPQNVFGRKFIQYRDPYIDLNPQGMFNQTQPKPTAYVMTTKPIIKKYNVV